jgi:hypothetical protein
MKTYADPGLAEQVRNADSYEALAELSERAGQPATVDELQAAFVARNASVLARQMVRRGLIDSVQRAPAPVWKQDVWDRVAALDFNPVMTQLVNRKDWSPERAVSAERRYRRFLYLTLTVVAPVVPTKEVDEFWHQHILNTKQYASDCERIAGYFVHHRPSSGSDTDEAEKLQDTFFETWLCYETLFGEPYEETIGAALLQRWPNVATQSRASVTTACDSAARPSPTGPTPSAVLNFTETRSTSSSSVEASRSRMASL